MIAKITDFFSPVVLLFARLWIGLIFFSAASAKLENWDLAIQNTTNSPLASWLSPETGAYTLLIIGMVGSIMLLVGFFTRIAAFGLLFIVLLEELMFGANIMHHAIIIASALFVTIGAGRFSIDYLLVGAGREKSYSRVTTIIHAIIMAPIMIAVLWYLSMHNPLFKNSPYIQPLVDKLEIINPVFWFDNNAK